MAEILNLKDDTNVAILNAIRHDASTDYQRRVPEATKANVRNQLQHIGNYRPAWNEFLDGLINRIGSVVARNISWQNPLAEFKTGLLQYGATIEEIQIGLIEAQSLDPDRDDLEREIFGTKRPIIESNFHTLNRQDRYKITVNESLLQRAFLDPSGLSSFVAQLLQAPSTSDAWDEFLLTVQLFKEYESNGGFYHVNVPDVRRIESSADDAKIALRKMRAMADTLGFISTRYNASKMPVAAKREDLLLFVTPEYNAAIDVEALAGAFNVSRADMHGRIIPIPEEHFGMDGVQAIMTTKDFFVIADNKLENTQMFNPANFDTNYWLHHWQVISASRFVPAVMFHTGADDEVVEVRKPVTAMTDVKVLQADGTETTTVAPGLIYAVRGAAVTTPGDGETGVIWSVEGQASPRTTVTQNGVLHVAPDETATTLKVTARSVWIDPENVRNDPLTKNVTLTVAGETLPEWPRNGHLVRVDILDTEIPVVNGTTDYTFVGPEKFSKNDVKVISEGPVSSTVSVSGRVATVKVDPGKGAEQTYTFTSQDAAA